MCLQFGPRSAPKLFNILADLLEWIASQRGVSVCLHYLDDFLTMGPPASPTCQSNLDILMQTCKELGVPLATEKLEGPSTTLTFLGVEIDTAKMEIRLPDDKLHRALPDMSALALGRHAYISGNALMPVLQLLLVLYTGCQIIMS